jgi:hypothetical protein
MASPQLPDPVKVFVALLYSPAADLETARQRMTRAWGAIDYAGKAVPFTATDYYEAEMGERLARSIISFEELARPEDLPLLKLTANEIETALSVNGRRTVNLDVGYLDIHKVVLASGKYDAQKVHLARGIYADLVLRYSRGEFHPFDWTFPDFRQGRYDADLLEVRERYKRRLRALREAP